MRGQGGRNMPYGNGNQTSGMASDMSEGKNMGQGRPPLQRGGGLAGQFSEDSFDMRAPKSGRTTNAK